jgi:cell division protein FtsQ
MSARRARNPWLKILILCLIGSGITALWYGYFNTTDPWPINKIKIHGDFAHLDTYKLNQQITDSIHGGFFNADIANIRAMLLNQAWIKDARIRRVWPDTLQIHITEQRPIAYWLRSDGKPALVNPSGEIFRPAANPDIPHLPVLKGATDKVPLVAHFYALIHTDAMRHKLRITQLHLNQRQEWRVHFSNGLKLMLGQAEHQRRWRNFMHIYADLTTYGEPQQIDMRYAHGVAVRWQNHSPAHADASSHHYEGKS